MSCTINIESNIEYNTDANTKGTILPGEYNYSTVNGINADTNIILNLPNDSTKLYTINPTLNSELHKQLLSKIMESVKTQPNCFKVGGAKKRRTKKSKKSKRVRRRRTNKTRK